MCLTLFKAATTSSDPPLVRLAAIVAEPTYRILGQAKTHGYPGQLPLFWMLFIDGLLMLSASMRLSCVEDLLRSRNLATRAALEMTHGEVWNPLTNRYRSCIMIERKNTLVRCMNAGWWQWHDPFQILNLAAFNPAAHHDFGYSERVSRSINLCIYLNEGMRGGETSFPRWRNGHTAKAMNMKPEKGKAMIFYMVNPDGNLDDLTQHAALPVLEGEKWFANLWIWDPFRA